MNKIVGIILISYLLSIEFAFSEEIVVTELLKSIKPSQPDIDTLEKNKCYKQHLFWRIKKGDILLKIESVNRRQIKTEFKLPFSLKNNPIKYFEYSSKNIVEVSNGFLISSFAGEFGSEVWWFSQNGEQSYLVSTDPVVQFMEIGNKIYAIGRKSHLLSSEGSLINFEKKLEKWDRKLIDSFDFAPIKVCCIDDDNFMLATDKGLFEYSLESNKLIKAHENQLWRSLHINSIGYLEPNQFILGFKSGVIRLKKNMNNNFSEEWFFLGCMKKSS